MAAAAAISCSFSTNVLSSSLGSQRVVAAQQQKVVSLVGTSNSDFWSKCTRIQSSGAGSDGRLVWEAWRVEGGSSKGNRSEGFSCCSVVRGGGKWGFFEEEVDDSGGDGYCG
ncbi:unnamed protein product [Calypogeia fissa]